MRLQELTIARVIFLTALKCLAVIRALVLSAGLAALAATGAGWLMGLVTGSPGRLGPPVERIEALPQNVQQQVDAFLGCSFVGSPQTVKAGLESFLADTGADELIVASAIFDHAARVRSYDLLAQAVGLT